MDLDSDEFTFEVRDGNLLDLVGGLLDAHVSCVVMGNIRSDADVETSRSAASAGLAAVGCKTW